MTIKIYAYDSYDNSKPGESGISLIPVRMSGALNTGIFANSGRQLLGSGPLLSLTSGIDTLTNVYYNVGQTIQFGLSGSYGNVAVTPTLAFQNTIHTVHGEYDGIS